MPDGLDASLYELPESALTAFVGAEAPSVTAAERAAIIARLRERIDRMRAQQREWSHRFDKFYDRALEEHFSTPFLIQWAAALLEKQRAALERVDPLIEALRRNLVIYQANNDTQMLQLCEEAFTVLFGWIAPYQELCGKVLDLASERRTEVDEVLHARPMQGHVDHEALSREFIARFPKIRAALARK